MSPGRTCPTSSLLPFKDSYSSNAKEATRQHKGVLKASDPDEQLSGSMLQSIGLKTEHESLERNSKITPPAYINLLDGKNPVNLRSPGRFLSKSAPEPLRFPPTSSTLSFWHRKSLWKSRLNSTDEMQTRPCLPAEVTDPGMNYAYLDLRPLNSTYSKFSLTSMRKRKQHASSIATLSKPVWSESPPPMLLPTLVNYAQLEFEDGATQNLKSNEEPTTRRQEPDNDEAEVELADCNDEDRCNYAQLDTSRTFALHELGLELTNSKRSMRKQTIKDDSASNEQTKSDRFRLLRSLFSRFSVVVCGNR